MGYKRLVSAVLLLMMMFCSAGVAEDYVDLNERFSDVVTFEYEDQTYYLKERVTTVLAACINADPQEGSTLELLLLLAVNDNAKTAALLQLDGAMPADWLEGESRSLNEIFSAEDGLDAGCERMVSVLNGLFPTEIVSSYVALDEAGLPLLDGIENDDENVSGDALVERLRAIKNGASDASTSELNDMLASLGDYIITDMKSGALMKIVDKMDRYDVGHRIPMPVEGAEEPQAQSGEAPEKPDADAEPPVLDADAFEALMIEVYFDDEPMW
ncbi:MAG: hypothetical protein ACI4MF_04195 [Candidatus Faecivicinus sp.]